MPAYASQELATFLKRVEPLVVKEHDAYVILSVDIDHFRPLSVSLEPEEAKQLFRKLLERLKNEVRANDVIEFTGRDSFAIFVNGITSDKRLAALCQRLLTAAHEPFLINGRSVLIKLSIGVARGNASAVPLPELVRRANVALHFQKTSRSSGFSIFGSSLDEELLRQQTIVGDLAAALDTDRQIIVHYQPLFSRDKLAVVGHEALVRWKHPTGKWLSPGEFLPQAEATGLIHPLGQYVLDSAARVALSNPNEFVAVNISPLQCQSISFADQAETSVRALGCCPEQFELEITEHVLLDNEQSSQTVQDLQSRGFRIVLDDFGSGYSSLAYLRRFPVDKIKIDRQFIAGLGADEKSIKIITAVVNLAHALGLKVTAEGVETERQLQLLQQTDCDELQGFLLGRPTQILERTDRRVGSVN